MSAAAALAALEPCHGFSRWMRSRIVLVLLNHLSYDMMLVINKSISTFPMLVFEYKAYGKSNQFNAVDEAIRTVQFIRNKAIRLWMGKQSPVTTSINTVPY